MSAPLTIVVGGYIVGLPLGGMTWHHLNYLLGLHAMGHDVYFQEDSGPWSMPYNPSTWKCEPDPSYGVDYLTRTFAQYGLPTDRWCYYSEPWERYYGMSETALNAVLSRADLLLCVSGVTPLRASRPRPKRTMVIDTDPVFTQLRMNEKPHVREYFASFDKVATFGTLIGTEKSILPTHGFNWIPTRQPISLPHWPMVESSSRRFSTLGKWEHTGERHVDFNGTRYLSSKGVEWIKLLNLPGKTKWEMLLAMQLMPHEIEEVFRNNGWIVPADPEKVSASCESYQRFIQESAGEFTVAKQIYSGLPSGWFSDRAACYLASGKPVITQRSGFEHWLPVGEGLFVFDSLDGAVKALEEVDRDYPRHSMAARAIAEKYFDSSMVLSELLDRAL
jgi:hypothetical protein